MSFTFLACDSQVCPKFVCCSLFSVGALVYGSLIFGWMYAHSKIKTSR